MNCLLLAKLDAEQLGGYQVVAAVSRVLTGLGLISRWMIEAFEDLKRLRP